MKKQILFLGLIGLLFLGACTSNSSQSEESRSTEQAEEKMSVEKTEEAVITIEELKDSPQFPDASLKLNSISIDENSTENNAAFNFTVENYTLGEQTSSPLSETLANSGKGQHIHLILNNEPYSAHYQTNFDKTLEEGNYVALAFLSRSYHESVKNETSFTVQEITVGNTEPKYDLTTPHLFYSRPKGSYKGDEIKNLLLDFFIVNTTLSEDGNKVRATINGNEFMISKWAPYIIKGLQPGELTVKLELIDKEGNLIKSPFNPVERTVTLEG